MSGRHFDVVILGRSVGALLSAALLAKREFRVLVLGQGELPPVYRAEGLPLLRRSFTLLSATSPAFRRILQELAQTQRFRRRTQPLDPMFGVLGRTLRFEVPPDIDAFSKEIEREFPEMHASIAEFYSLVSEANSQIDGVFERPLIWPPGTFWERLETGRLAAHLPLNGGEQEEDSVAERLPKTHPYRDVAEVTALFSSALGLDTESLSPLAFARLHGAWTRGVHALEGGEAELEAFLVERIEGHGGVCRLESKATRLLARRGRVAGVEEDGDGRWTGTDAVVTNMTGEALALLCDPAAIPKKSQEIWPHVTVVGGQFVVNAILPTRAVPAPLPVESFLLSASADLPVVHLQRRLLSTLTSSVEGEALADRTLLTAECLCPTGRDLLGLRQAIVAALERYIPFFEENVELIDSPHDGLPAYWFEVKSGVRIRREIDRVHLTLASPISEPMRPRLVVDPVGYRGLGGEPLRGPIPGTFLVGPSVLPALGQEGEALAALSVAQLLTRKDASRQKMRRKLWTKIETS